MLLTVEEVKKLRKRYADIVVTNGCFDILHVGHVRYLKEASKKGLTLVVGINDDKSVRKLKGPTRPINTALERAEVLLGLRFVDFVCIFSGTTATKFLQAAKPNVYVKGGDYTIDTLNKAELAVLRKAKSEIFFVPLVEGKSTTKILNAD